MRINNNIMAMNAHRQLGVNSGAQGKSIEKLSSGFRINRAGDDAAGLAISEKMRSQVRGLGKASRNAQDDISLIQTTEGALNETHAIIHRMREMAVQSANDSNTDQDREALQAEMDQLAEEVTRIANDTEFNTRKVLNGNLDKGTNHSTGDITFHIGANTNQNIKFGVSAMDAKSLDLTEDYYTGAGTGAVKNVEVSRAERSQSLEEIAGKEKEDDRKIAITTAKGVDGKTAKTAVTTVGKNADGTKDVAVSIDFKVTGEKYNDINIRFEKGSANTAPSATFSKDTKTITIKLDTADGGAENTEAKITAAITGLGDVDGYKFGTAEAKLSGGTEIDLVDSGTNFNSDGGKTKGGTDTTWNVTGTAANGAGTEVITVKESDTKVAFNAELKGLSFKTDDVTKVTGDIILDVDRSSAATFNVDHSVENSAKAVKGINILTQGAANKAIERIDSALKKVSDVRAGLGAVQNRLEHTIKNVDTAAENLQASESRIRDVDMAKEMMTYTKNNILNQAAQSMLAQANQLPQGVLQLLR